MSTIFYEYFTGSSDNRFSFFICDNNNISFKIFSDRMLTEELSIGYQKNNVNANICKKCDASPHFGTVVSIMNTFSCIHKCLNELHYYCLMWALMGYLLLKDKTLKFVLM